MLHIYLRERMDPLTEISLAFFFSLVICHLVVDFVLQPDRWVRDKIKNKWRSRYLYIHSALAGLLAGLVTLYFCGLVPAGAVIIVVFMTHLIIDGLKAQYTENEGDSTTCTDIRLFFGDRAFHLTVAPLIIDGPEAQHADKKGDSAACKNLRLFFGDQAFHLIVLILIWWSICVRNLPLSSPYFDGTTIYTISVLLLGYLIVLWPGKFFIAKILSYIGLKADREKKEDEDDGLKNAGKYIGCLERLLILSFILAGQYVAIGFLVGAKAIFRYTESRTVGEYILTGTLLSYSVAIIAGMGVEYLLSVF